MRSIAPWRKTTISQFMSPTSSTTSTTQRLSAAIFQDESVDIDIELSYSGDAELDDELIGKALSLPLFIQEREEPANLRQIYHSHDESLLPAQYSFTRTSTERPSSNPILTCLKNGNQVATQKNSESGFSLKDKKRATYR